MTKPRNDTAQIAANLATVTAQRAVELATTAAATATALANKTSETTAIISNDISWMKKSLAGIEITLKEMTGAFVTSIRFGEFERDAQDRETRIRALEQNMWKLVGMTSVITTIITISLGFVLKLIR